MFYWGFESLRARVYTLDTEFDVRAFAMEKALSLHADSPQRGEKRLVEVIAAAREIEGFIIGKPTT